MWILTLWGNPIARKIIIGVAAGLVIYYGLRLWSSRVYSEGYRSGKMAGALETEKAERAKWKAQQDAIEVEAARVDGDRKLVDAQTAALAQSRRQIETTLSRSLNEMKKKREVDSANVLSVPDSELDDALRSVSAVLAGGAASKQ
jgi:hypothetical protein